MDTPATFLDLSVGLLELINIIILAVFAFLFIYLIWKLIDSWILHAGDEMSRTEGKKYATLAVLVFVLMVSTWGIILILRISIFGF